MSESVDILIKAEDMATPVVAKSAKSVDALDASIKRIKTSGDQAKKSTEFFGTIANSLGGSEIGSYASQLAGITEKTSQFAEVQKLGGAGALAFKAGLVGVAGVLGFQVGKSISDTIYQTERWNAAIEESKVKARELGAELLRLQAIRAKDTQEDIDLTRDPAERIRLTQEHAKELAKQLGNVEGGAHATKAALDAVAEIRGFGGTDWFGIKSMVFDKFAGRSVDALKAQHAEQEASRKQLFNIVTETEKLTVERTLANEALRKENEEKDKSDQFIKGLRDEVELLRASKEEQSAILALRNAVGEQAQQEAKALMQEKQSIADREAANQKAITDQQAITQGSENYVKSLRDQLVLLKATDDQKASIQAAQKAVGGDVGVAADLLREIDSIKSLTVFEKMRDEELKKIQGEKETAAQRLIDLKQSELDKLDEERILLTQGAEAAQAFRLAKQGLAEADAVGIAKQQAELDKLKEANKPGKVVKQDKPELQAFESRFLTRGPSNDAATMTAQNSAITAAELKILNAAMAREAKERVRNAVTLKVVGK